MKRKHELPRLWGIFSKDALNTDLLSEAFRHHPIEIEDRHSAFVLTPARWKADDVQTLLEQDGMGKVIIVKGPMQKNTKHLDLARDIVDDIYTLGQRLMPQKLVYTYEHMAQFIAPDKNRVLLSSLLDEYELIHTLNLYCEYDMNLTKSANALYLHRNTLIYRLNRLTEISGFNTKSPCEVINLYYVLKHIK